MDEQQLADEIRELLERHEGFVDATIDTLDTVVPNVSVEYPDARFAIVVMRLD